MAGDASNRSYDRLKLGGENRVLMVAPPEKGEDIRPFVQITDLLRNQSLSAPEIFASDPELGLMLIEDLGDDLFARLAGDPVVERELYDAAVDVLATFGGMSELTDVAPYDTATYQREARLVTEWYIPAVTGAKVAEEDEAQFLDLIAEACANATENTLVLRDYHAENLLWLPERGGNARVGLLDYQDALLGDRVYDLVSLLEDARRDVSNGIQNAEKKRFLESGGFEERPFQQVYSALGAQRNLKIVGIFTRLAVRDGKAHYPDLIPRVWGYLMGDLGHPSLTVLKDWVDRHVPPPTPANLAAIRDKVHAG